MKQWWLFVLILLFPLAGFAQSFRVYKGDTINVTDKKGLKQGAWKRYYESDTLFTITNYKDGKPIGATMTQYPSGKLKARVIHQKKGRRSLMTGFHENDSIMVTGIYIDMKKDSGWSYYNEQGVLTSVEWYRAGKEHGKWKVFYGTGKLSAETAWKNGVRHGPVKQYFENGKAKFEAVNNNGSFEGKCLMYHPNGQVWFTGQYVDGIQTGSWVFNNEKGMRDSVQVFVNGLPTIQNE